jgi:hypothetical protein
VISQNLAGAAMVERLAGNATLLPPDVIAEIVERSATACRSSSRR